MNKKIVTIVIISMFLVTSSSIFVNADQENTSIQIIIKYYFKGLIFGFFK